MKVAFLDRDGTIVRDYPDEEWGSVVEPEFLPSAIGALAAILSRGFDLIILTNQYTIGEGIITSRQYEQFTTRMMSHLAGRGIRILDVFHCPDSRDTIDNCLKPRPWLINCAMRRYPDIDLARSFMAGDSSCDAELALRVGLRFFAIGIAAKVGYGIPVQSLADIVHHL